VDIYAENLLNEMKEPVYAISAKSKRLYDFKPHYTLNLNLGGTYLAPAILGMDIDPIRKTTDFILDAYSSRNLETILNQIYQKAK